MKLKALYIGLTLFCISQVCQSQTTSKANFKIFNSFNDGFYIEVTLKDVILLIDDSGRVLSAGYFHEGDMRNKNGTNIEYWGKGWGKEKEGKMKSFGDTSIDYWSTGWGKEREGKVKSIGSVSIDYWGKGWGKEKEGKVKSIDSISIDYWGKGWGKEKEGKIRTIGNSTIDYWGEGWGKEEALIIKTILCLNKRGAGTEPSTRINRRF
jgi:hypothetical protein